MSDPVCVSRVLIKRRSSPVRWTELPGESRPLAFNLHGAIAEHYGLDPAGLPEVKPALAKLSQFELVIPSNVSLKMLAAAAESAGLKGVFGNLSSI
jgi:hypothetical protein